MLAWTVLAGTACAGAEEQQLLQFDEAVTLALQAQPQIEALDQQAQAALQAARAESELPDPKLAFGPQNVPVEGAHAFRLDADEMTMLSVGLMQDVVLRRKREASAAGMASQSARFAAERETAMRVIRREAAFAWLDAFEAQVRAVALRRLVAEMSAERAVGARSLASASSSASAILALDAEISRTRDELIIAQRDEMRARARLSRWLGEHALRPLPEALPHERIARAEHTRVRETALEAHPMIASAERAIDVARHEADRARADRRPDWGWQLMYGQRRDLPDLVTLQVTVGLPWNRADRQDRRLAEKLAMASAAHSEMLDRRRHLSAEFIEARADLEASAARLREHEEHLLPTARARMATAEGAYASGSGSLAEVWQARRALVDVSLHHEMILADRMRAFAQLEYLVGPPEEAP